MHSLNKEESRASDETVPVSLLVSVGDLSADKHASKLISKLKSLHSNIHVWGLGSSAMRKAGAEILYDCQEFSSIGPMEVVKLFPFLAKVRSTLLKEIENRRPKAVLLIDYGGFNLVLAQTIRSRYKNLPIYYFISPQVWGSRPWRINTIAKTITKMLVIFPFEENLYAAKNIPVSFVGHPLTKNMPGQSALLDRNQFAKKYNLDQKKPIIGIFAGSRKSEIKNLFPITLAAAKQLNKERPDIQFAISQANQALAQEIEKTINTEPLLSNLVKLTSIDDSYNLMSACDLAWAKSGTTTLELTLFAKPMLIFYRADWLSYLIFLAFKRTQRVGWPNLLAGKDLVPELIQLDCSPEKLVQYSKDILDVPGLGKEISQQLQALRNKLGEGDYAEACASEIAEALSN